MLYSNVKMEIQKCYSNLLLESTYRKVNEIGQDMMYSWNMSSYISDEINKKLKDCKDIPSRKAQKTLEHCKELPHPIFQDNGLVGHLPSSLSPELTSYLS